MKILKGFAIFIVTALVMGSCFDAPSFGPNPVIEFERIEFVQVGGPADQDSLNIFIRFKDGDGDLGLTATQIESPYHPVNFYSGVGLNLVTLSAKLYNDFTGLKYKSSGKTPTNATYVIDSAPADGKLVSLTDKSIYNLPPYISPFTCALYDSGYLQDTIFVKVGDKSSLRPIDIVDTLVDGAGESFLYAALQKWYVQPNPNHYNITVKFLVGTNKVDPQGNTIFEEFNFPRDLNLCTTYDARFPKLADETRPLEGTLLYAVIGSGFLQTFSIKKLKLEIQIKDRALNLSNVITTHEFTLKDITK